MRAVCPNDPSHKRFLTTAHVMEEWIVDSKGDFVELVGSIETTHGPSRDNLWTCAECGAIAQHED